MWTGDYFYLLRELVVKDFKLRYRTMSLGVFWSLLNPLVLMAVWTYVFTVIFTNPIEHFSVHILAAIIPFNFFTMAWLGSTTSLVDNSGLIKRIPIRREIIPIAVILSNLTHVVIQLFLLLIFVYAAGLRPNVYWLLLPLVWGLELVFLFGLGLACSALNVFIRDMRYVVESINIVLFWVVPIIYSFSMVPQEMRGLYQYNPLAALILATHNIVLDGQAPSLMLIAKLTFVALASLMIGTEVFRRSERRFYEYL